MKNKVLIFIPGFPPSMHKFEDLKQVAKAYLGHPLSLQLIEQIDEQQPEPWILLALEMGTPNAMRQAMMKVYWPILDRARSQASLMARSDLFYDQFDDELLELLSTKVPEHVPAVVEVPLNSEDRHVLLNAIHLVARRYEEAWKVEMMRRERQKHGGRKKPPPAAYAARKSARSAHDRAETARRKGKRGA